MADQSQQLLQWVEKEGLSETFYMRIIIYVLLYNISSGKLLHHQSKWIHDLYLQADKEELRIVEGGESSKIEIESEFPPFIFCPSGDCEIIVQPEMEGSKELKCEGQAVPQVLLVGESEKGELKISGENWRNKLVISVQANMDMLKDGDQDREVMLVSRVRDRNQTSQQMETSQRTVVTRKKVRDAWNDQVVESYKQYQTGLNYTCLVVHVMHVLHHLMALSPDLC